MSSESRIEAIIEAIRDGQTSLGIELGSTQIKSTLIGSDFVPLASGVFQWENQNIDGLWTYDLADAVTGLQASYSSLRESVEEQYGVTLDTVGAIGISAMMHGYLPLDKDGQQIAPFLTWRNTNTAEAADNLTQLFDFNIPHRWSIAHLYQAILEGREHVSKLAHLCTLAGWIHYRLTGEMVIGVGDASGMFPIDSETNTYDETMLETFRQLISAKHYDWDIANVLPRVLVAGEAAGALTTEGAALLDVTGALKPGIPFAPPEGDAATGMTATNSVSERTGNVSYGTSIFSMVVLERPLREVHRELDLVTTPGGRPVAMVHCNNGTSELNEWVGLFSEFAEELGCELSTGKLFETLFVKSLEGDSDCGGLVTYNYTSGEPITGFDRGCPLVLNPQGAQLNLANFFRAQLYSSMATMIIGMDILAEEDVRIDRLTGHGGIFKTPGVVQRYLAAATRAPVSVMDTAGEGGSYGMALLAAYVISEDKEAGFESFVENRVFAGVQGSTLAPLEADIEGYQTFLDAYRKNLTVEAAAVENL